MKTTKELATQARDLWHDLSDAFKADLDKVKSRDKAEVERLSRLHTLFGNAYQGLSQHIFDYERLASGEGEAV